MPTQRKRKYCAERSTSSHQEVCLTLSDAVSVADGFADGDNGIRKDRYYQESASVTQEESRGSKQTHSDSVSQETRPSVLSETGEIGQGGHWRDIF